MPGKGAKSKKSARKAKNKQAAKKAAKQRDKFVASLPHISEDDLLSFQFQHFGDDTKPNDWFVDPEAATNFELEPEDDGLGYYPDGVKRTLTDEQIAMFRRSELWHMQREQMQQQEEAKEREQEQAQVGARSPVSDASSLEDDLLSYASRPGNNQPSGPKAQLRKSSSSRQSNTSGSTGSWKRKRSEKEVPYDQRHKRKWESYVDQVDSIEGSLTHRRMARELDDRQTEPVELDY